MNNEERNVRTILTIARILESSLWYCLPATSANGFSLEERTQRGKALVSLTQEGTPFAVNCDRNGDTGKKLKEDRQYFIEDVYGNPGRIVTVDINSKVHVEESLILELYSSIVSLRSFLERFLTSALKALKEQNKLDQDFYDLIRTDIRYYHAFSGKISCILIANKFRELNKNVKTYAESYSKSHNGIDPNKDPEFDVHNDPSFRRLENEFHELNQDRVNVLNTYGDKDPDFAFARSQVYSDAEIFTGKKQTSDLRVFFDRFTSYFDTIIKETRSKLNIRFIKAGEERDKKVENKPAPAPAAKAAPAAEPAEEKKD